MRISRQSRFLPILFFLFVADRPASADMDNVVSQLVKICFGGGSANEVEGAATAETAITLKALRTGNIGGTAGVAGKYKKSEWEGLIGGINSNLTQLQADQADKARECLKPYMPGIVQAILSSK